MGGMIQPLPGVGPIGGRIFGDILTGGLAEAMPKNIREPLYQGMGSVFFSPASALAAGGAGLAAGGLGAGGFGAAAPSTATAGGAGLEGLSQFAGPSAAAQTLAPTGAGSLLPAGGVAGLSDVGGGLRSGAALNAGSMEGAKAAGMSKSDMLQNAFLATSIGGMLGHAIHPPPLYPPAGIPAPPIGHSSGFTPVASNASQQWAQLMAQRRAQQTGKFTV